MCEAPLKGVGGVAVTESGLKYYLDTPEGHAAAAADMRAVGGPGAGESSQPPVEQQAEPPQDCDEYDDSMWDKPCSKYFKFAHMKYKPVDNPEAGLTSKDIACNWKKTCELILDPLVDAGFKVNINSGYRTPAYDKTLGAKNGLGDHPCGRAVDVSIQGGNVGEDAKKLFKWVGQNLSSVYSQIIFEGQWVHVAHSGPSPASVAVLVTRTGAAPYQNGGGKSGAALPPDLKWA